MCWCIFSRYIFELYFEALYVGCQILTKQKPPLYKHHVGLITLLEGSIKLFNRIYKYRCIICITMLRHNCVCYPRKVPTKNVVKVKFPNVQYLDMGILKLLELLRDISKNVTTTNCMKKKK